MEEEDCRTIDIPLFGGIHMRVILNFGIAILSCSILLPADTTRANAQENDGPSRSELFARFVRAPAEADLGVLSSSLPVLFRFPTHVREDGIFGIDVSHHNEDGCNCSIDWNAVANQKISFAYMKATQGAFYRDVKFDNNWKILAQHPTIYRGAYHFLSSAHDPIDQAKNFLAKIGPMQAKDMPPCLDIEWDMLTVDGQQIDAWGNLSPEAIVDRALKWLNHVETATGRIPVIYTSQAWWRNRIKDDKAALFHRYPIWIADYSEKGLGQEKPSVLSGEDWKIWQFTEKGVLEQGIPGHVDANIFKGSMDEFRQTFGISLTVPVPNVNKTDATPVPNTGSTGNSGTPGDLTTASTTPGGTVTPKSYPANDIKKDANLGTPKSGNTPNSSTSGPGGANTQNVTPAAKTANTTTRKAAPKIDPFDVFGDRGGPFIRIE